MSKALVSYSITLNPIGVPTIRRRGLVRRGMNGQLYIPAQIFLRDLG